MQPVGHWEFYQLPIVYAFRENGTAICDDDSLCAMMTSKCATKEHARTTSRYFHIEDSKLGYRLILKL
ncbi:hypothetical protein T4A_3048 [Trichinella pseudospiralis]|uniref:Uncharacterized protein n=1 Tax=Trichinella pseudospiralis TaxID=6337 RepID=A0A0V0XN19_TRIPS|nr:hypothetical protein T4E_3238 [Trichinella pseudospiralis]KRY66250.1 hypothetical protein T4A_3048 [Trichinella pseudospiralis]